MPAQKRASRKGGKGEEAVALGESVWRGARYDALQALRACRGGRWNA